MKTLKPDEITRQYLDTDFIKFQLPEIPKLKLGDVIGLETPINRVNGRYVICQVPTDKAGTRCWHCDATLFQSDIDDYAPGMVLDRSCPLSTGLGFPSVCTIEIADRNNVGVYAVLKNLDEVMEEL